MKIISAYFFLFFGLGLNYLFNVYVARSLAPENYGYFSYAISVFNIFSLIAVAGLDEAAIRFIPQTENKTEYIKAIQWFAIAASVTVAVVNFIVSSIYFEGILRTTSQLLALCIPLFVFITVSASILQAQHIVAKRMMLRYGIEPIIKIVTVIVLFQFSISIEFPVFALFFALLVTNIVSFCVFKNILFDFFRMPSPVVANGVFKFISPMIFYNILNVISGRLDILILGAYVSAFEIGQYSAAFQTASMLAIVLQGIETVYAPIFSNHIGKNDLSALEFDYKRALRWTVIIASPILLIFFLYPALVLFPFGRQYSVANDIVFILCIGQLINLATGSANTILLAMGKTKIVLLNTILYLVCSVVFVGVGAHCFGLNGAAAGVVCAFAVPNILRLIFVYKQLGCLPFSIGYYKAIAAFVSCIFINNIIKDYVGIAAIFINTILFFVILYCLGLQEEDREVIKGIKIKLIAKI